MIKALKIQDTQGSYLNVIKAVYEKPIVNIILNRKKTMKTFPLKSGIRKVSILTILIQNEIYNEYAL
jgi:hypothetical protein